MTVTGTSHPGPGVIIVTLVQIDPKGSRHTEQALVGKGLVGEIIRLGIPESPAPQPVGGGRGILSIKGMPGGFICI